MKKHDLIKPVLIILFASGLAWAQENLNIEDQKAKEASVLNDRGITNVRAARYTEALENFKQSIAFKPDFARPYNNLGMTYTIMGRSSQAREALQKAVQI